MASKIKPLVEGAKKVGKKIWPSDQRLARDLARRTKDVNKRFATKKELLDHAKSLGIKDPLRTMLRSKEGRQALAKRIAVEERRRRNLMTEPVRVGPTARTALDVALTVPRAVTALGSFQAPAGAGPVRRFMRGGALVHGATQAGKGGYLFLGKGEKADAARREALREYGADAEFMGQKAADLEIGSPQNLLRSAEAGFLNPAESVYASTQAAKLMAEQSKDWEQEGLAKYNPFTYKTGTYTGPQMAQGGVRALADTDKDGVISEEERAAFLESRPSVSGATRKKIGRARLRSAADKKYVRFNPLKEDGVIQKDADGKIILDENNWNLNMPPEIGSLGADSDYFLGRPDDPEFVDREKEELGLEEGVVETYSLEQSQQPYRQKKEFFNEQDRKDFLKAAKDGTLLAAFDINDDGKLERKEKKLFFDKEQGFKARRDEIMKAGADLIPAPDLPMEPAAIEGDLPVHAAGSDFDRPEYGGTVGELEEPTEAPEPPPTTREYADMMRQAIDNEAIGIEERNEVMRTIRESMVEQGLTTPEQFNRIGRQMLEDSDARKAAAHVAYLRSPAGSDWVDTPGLDRLAALQKAPFGRGTALEGSVGKLTDESRQLESIGGRQRRLARELEGKGYRSVAGQVRAGAPRRPLMSQRDRIELEKKKKALAAEQAAAQALISKGEENINANTVS